MILATYATIFEGAEAIGEGGLSEAPDAVIAAFVKTINLLGERSFLAGLGDLERLVTSTDPGKPAGKMAARIATSFVLPAIVRAPREMLDPYRRSIDVGDNSGSAFYQAFTKAYRNAVPGWSEGVPPAVDAFGNDKVNIGSRWYRGIVPIKGATIVDDRAAAALIATATPINKPDYKISIGGGPEIDLLQMDDGAGWVYRDYQMMVGRARNRWIKEVMDDPEWEEQLALGNIRPDTPMAVVLAKAVRKGREEAFGEFLEKYNKGLKSITPKVGGEEVVGKIELTYPLYELDYEDIYEAMVEKGPIKSVREEAATHGLVIKSKSQQRGLPPEMRF